MVEPINFFQLILYITPFSNSDIALTRPAFAIAAGVVSRRFIFSTVIIFLNNRVYNPKTFFSAASLHPHRRFPFGWQYSPLRSTAGSGRVASPVTADQPPLSPAANSRRVGRYPSCLQLIGRGPYKPDYRTIIKCEPVGHAVVAVVSSCYTSLAVRFPRITHTRLPLNKRKQGSLSARSTFACIRRATSIRLSQGSNSL